MGWIADGSPWAEDPARLFRWSARSTGGHEPQQPRVTVVDVFYANWSAIAAGGDRAYRPTDAITEGQEGWVRIGHMDRAADME